MLATRFRATGASVGARPGHSGTAILAPDEVRKFVDELRLPVPFDINAMRDVIAQLRGKPVLLSPYDTEVVASFENKGEALPAAMCLSQPHADYVFYREDTTRTHQEHSMLHEFGHLLLGHAESGARRRSLYDEPLEHAAELFADLVIRRIGTMRARPEGPAEPNHADTIDRYGSILEG